MHYLCTRNSQTNSNKFVLLFSRLALSLQAETENQMNNSKSLYYIFIIIAAAVMYSCANIGNPSGGPIDKTPPIFMRSNPTPNAVNVKDRKIEIFFDEIPNIHLQILLKECFKTAL